MKWNKCMNKWLQKADDKNFVLSRNERILMIWINCIQRVNCICEIFVVRTESKAVAMFVKDWIKPTKWVQKKWKGDRRWKWCVWMNRTKRRFERKSANWANKRTNRSQRRAKKKVGKVAWPYARYEKIRVRGRTKRRSKKGNWRSTQGVKNSERMSSKLNAYEPNTVNDEAYDDDDDDVPWFSNHKVKECERKG